MWSHPSARDGGHRVSTDQEQTVTGSLNRRNVLTGTAILGAAAAGAGADRLVSRAGEPAEAGTPTSTPDASSTPSTAPAPTSGARSERWWTARSGARATGASAR
ncbi:twin-arginine translocation signal domain-containing protein [Nocardioides sp. MAH-18]|uniref:Twin-arginine translocation signal domain-containing protein n=1 Tax=Nocardioides agri TaxID=2682843 RepID=A0A6L6XWA1_9ACTN|nr:twin-arginine translocation signal domain-containing protein [Nocardioides sp. MAH-18]